MIKLQDLNIGYSVQKQNHSVFENINLSFERGELIGLVGDNGIGKSTLLKTITGNIKPLKGTVLINQLPIETLSKKEISKNVAIVLTDRVGGFNLTVFDVVASGRIPYLNAFGQVSAEDQIIIKESLEKTGLVELSDRLIEELSDGQRQKVMIAKSFAQQTPVILLDEPTAFLDHTSKQNLFKLLKQLCDEQQKTILVSSHDLDILFKNADKVLYLKNSKEFILDKPENIRKYFV